MVYDVLKYLEVKRRRGLEVSLKMCLRVLVCRCMFYLFVFVKIDLIGITSIRVHLDWKRLSTTPQGPH